MSGHMIDNPQFPPLLSGHPVAAAVSPFDKAISQAIAGVDSGSIFYSQAVDRLQAALVLAPEMPLKSAIQAVYVAQVGLAESLGALAPPEVPVHFQWPNRIKVNGARCGTLRWACSTQNSDDEPLWIVIGIDVPFVALSNSPGETPDQTTLHDEGCVEFTPMALLESWSKHTLLWLTHFLDEGFEKIHKEWRPRCDTIGEEISSPKPGLFVGLDEHGQMLLRNDGMTEALSLIDYSENA